MIQQLMTTAFLFVLSIFSLTTDCMDVVLRGYNVTIKNVPNVADNLTVKIDQWSPAPKKTCSFSLNFAAGTCECEDEQNSIDSFSAAHKSFTNAGGNSFLWDIPNFGLIQLQPDGTMFLGHDKNEAPLKKDYLRLNTPGKLFLENLHVFSLRTKSETHLRQTLTTDKLWVDWGTKFYNHGYVKANQLGNGGTFINKGIVEFEGTAQKPALLRIWEFHNDTHEQGEPRPTVRATHLHVTTNNTLDNKKGALFEVSEEFVAELHPPCYGIPSVFHNNGEFKASAVDLKRELVNNGFLQADRLTAQVLHNTQTGRIDIFNKLLVDSLVDNGKITHMSPASHYYLTVKQLPTAGKFAIQMSKTLQGNKEICSLIADFNASNYYKEHNMKVPYNIGHKKGFDKNAANNFLWDIPQLGLITVQQDGSVFLGHDPATTQLTQDEFTVRTPGKLFLDMLRVGRLNLKSPEAHIGNCVIADQVHADRTVYNHAALQTKQLIGKGEFINQGRVAFQGTEQEPARLSIAAFTNDKHNPRDHKPQPNVAAEHLRITEECERVRNEKGAHFEVAKLTVTKATSDNGFLYNKGTMHANKIDAQRKFVSKGLVQADQFTSAQLLNQKSGRVKIFSRIVADDLTNDGEIDANKSIEVQHGTNKGSITGSPKFALVVKNEMKNYGNIRLHQLMGRGHLRNRKTLLFNDNASITIKNITNDGLLKASTLDVYNTHVSNTISGVIEFFEKSIIKDATILNNGNLLMQGGDIDFKSTTLRNYNAMKFRSGEITCVDSTLDNKDKGNWLMENIKSVQPIEMDNEGVLELIDSSIGFERMRNHKELLIRGGTSTFKKFINSGVVKTDLLHLVSQALLQNMQGGSVEVFEKSIIHCATITNNGDLVMQGDTNFTLARVYNKNNMTIREGAINCTPRTLHNLATGKLLMEGMKSVQPITMRNAGLLELAESSLDFNKLQNDQKLVLYSGAYTINDFKNKTLHLCDTDWAITGNAALPADNKLVLTNPNITQADLGHIQGERDLLYDFAVIPNSLQAVGIDLSDRLCTLQELQAITTTGKVIARCSPEQLAQGDIELPNIGHLELFVTGPLTKYGSLKTPALTLHVQGTLTVGKSNTELGTIAATHGPLVIDAESIDGYCAQLYGKGKTDIIATKGHIIIGAPARGVDEDMKQQFMAGIRSDPWPGNPYYGIPYMHMISYYINLRNGAFAASDNVLTLQAAKKISIYYGTLKSTLGTHLLAPTEVANAAGNISSYGPISIESDFYNHTRAPTVGTFNFPYTMAGWTYYPGSVAAMLESLDTITFKTKKIYNLAGSIRATESIIINNIIIHEPKELTPATGYVAEPQHCYAIRCDNVPYRMYLAQSCIVQAGKTIQMNLGDFVITGNMNAPGMFMFARTGLFANSCMTRDTKNITQPILVDVTKYMRQEAQQSGFYALDAQGAVQTQFPFGAPSAPQAGDLVALANPAYVTPLNWHTIFNPLSSINLDLHLQRLLSEFAGKVYAGNARGKQSSRVLWGNANRWRQQQGKEIMSPADLQQINQSMLLAQIAHNGMTEEQRMLLCIAPQDINAYQAPGDIVADEFVCITENDQTHVNNRIIAQGPAGVTLQSQTGDINLQTQAYTVQYSDGDGGMVTEQRAYPQQQLIAQQGPVNVIAHQNITRVGTAIAAGTHVHEHAQTGSVTQQPLILQKTTEKTEVKDGLFSSKTTITTDVSHSILPPTTVAGTHIHTQAGSSIHAVASQDVAQESITKESPNTIIEGIIVANSTTTKTSTSSMFTDQSTYQSQETPCAMPATIQAPIVRLSGDAARINANISARELHDDTIQGAQFVALVKEMLYSQQTLVDSPFMSLDAGCKGGYEIMIQPMLMVDQIIRNRNIGHMLFESAIIDKTRTQIIGDFVETTYQLKKWEERWCHKSQLICDEGLVLIALAIAIFTEGAGVELLAGVLETVTAATGMQLTAAGVAMVNAGVTAICCATTTSFLSTGDPLQTVEHLVSDKFLKSLAVSMASAGLCSQLGGMLDINMASGIKPLVDHVQEQALRSTVDALLNVAINDMSVDQALGNACKQIPLNAVAAYVSNQICTSHLGSIGQKAAHTLLGGATGFATQGNKKGFASGAIGALTAQTVGDLLTADAFAISDAAITHLKKAGTPLTQENINKAIDKEIAYRMKIAKITAGTVAALAKLNPALAMQTAANVIDNDMAIRAQMYASAEIQALLTAATQAVTHLKIPAPAAADQAAQQPNVAVAKTRKKRQQPEGLSAIVSTTAEASAETGRQQMKRSSPQDHRETDAAHNLFLHALQQPANPYGDLIMECADEWQPHNYAQKKKPQRSLMERIVNPEMSPFIEKTSEIIRTAAQQTIDTFAFIPNPVGLACFATSTGRDLYQERTTLGELAFNTALTYGALKGIQLTGRGIKRLYDVAQSKLRRSTPEVYVASWKDSLVGKSANVTPGTDSVLNKLYQRRSAERRIPFVENPLAGEWSSATMSGDLVLGSDVFNIAYEKCTRYICKIDPAAPFNVVSHGNSLIMALETQNIHPKALSQANLRILKEQGEVILNTVQLARVIRTALGYKKWQPIHLFSCETGAVADGIAQKLSTRMGVEVSAFTENVHVFNDIPLFSAYCQATGKVGAVKTFYPKSGVSKAVASSILLSGCDSSPSSSSTVPDEQQTRQQRSLMDRIVNPETSPLIEETSEVIRTAAHKTIDAFAYVPNPVGLACFAAETGRDIYQGETTPGEVIFNAAVAYGALKGIQLTSRGIKKLYQKGKGMAQDVTDATLNRLHQKRYASEGRVPFVQNPRSGQWQNSEAAISGNIILTADANLNIKLALSEWKKDPAAPFNVFCHGDPSSIWLDIPKLHPKALSQANLKILKERGMVMLNEVQVARIIHTAPGYKGQHINLFSCECAAKNNGIAQKLSTRKNVPVSAFTEIAHLGFTGVRFSFGTSSQAGKKGAIKTFYPENQIFPNRLATVTATLPALLLAGSESLEVKPVDTYDDLIHDLEKYTKKHNQQRSLMDRIVNPTNSPFIKVSSEVIRTAAHKTIDTFAYVPNPVGLACFAAETGRDIYQGETTPGEVIFNIAAAYGVLKGMQSTGKVIKKLYQKARHACVKPVPFVQDAQAGTWKLSEITMSDDLILNNVASYLAIRSHIARNPAAPFNVVADGGPGFIYLSKKGMHLGGLSKNQLLLLEHEGSVMLNDIPDIGRLIKTAPGYFGQPVNIMACNFGIDARGAQQLSTYMRVPITAFNGRIVYKRDGSKFAAVISKAEGRKFGVMKTFYPETSKSKILARLLSITSLPALLLSGSESVSAINGCAIDTHYETEPTDHVYINPVDTHDDLMKKYAELKPFVDDPERGVWDDACISGDLVLDGRKDHAYYALRSKWKRDKKCPFNVLVHGTPFNVIVNKQDIHPDGLSKENENILRVKGEVYLNVHELKHLIETAPGYKKGQHINLLSCNCGVEDEGIAQQLADEMQVPVSAFTGIVSTWLNRKSGTAWFTAEDSKYGLDPREMKTFYPRPPEQRPIHDAPKPQWTY